MSLYVSPSILGYNSNPPSDDGSETSDNEVVWATIKEKLADPLKTFSEAVDTALETAFGKILFNQFDDITANKSVAATDNGTIFIATNTITVSLLAAATATDGFVFGIYNNGTGVITIDPNSSETIDGATTITLLPGDAAIIGCDGTKWLTVSKRIKEGTYAQEADASPSSGTVTCDMSLGSYRKITAGGNFTLDFTPPSGKVAAYVVECVNFGAHTVTLTGIDQTPAGDALEFTSSGTDLLVAVADNDGTVRAYLAGSDFQ